MFLSFSLYMSFSVLIMSSSVNIDTFIVFLSFKNNKAPIGSSGISIISFCCAVVILIFSAKINLFFISSYPITANKFLE